MSFATSVKEELAAITVKSLCCRRALLYGMMLSAYISEDTLCFSTDNDTVASLAAKLIRELGGKVLSAEEGRYAGRVRHMLTFSFPKLICFLRALEEEETPLSLPGKSCTGCIQTFLRGIFLSMGTVNDPMRSYHAELLIPNAKRAEKTDELLADIGLSARRIQRGERVGLYYKSSTAIEELFAEMGAGTVVFRFANAKIEHEIRNNENRATNCDTRNIARSVTAARIQIAAITRLKESGILGDLPSELQVTAKLRLLYGEDSLAELAARHEPPITKSGLNHRLARLCTLADKTAKG